MKRVTVLTILILTVLTAGSALGAGSKARPTVHEQQALTANDAPDRSETSAEAELTWGNLFQQVLDGLYDLIGWPTADPTDSLDQPIGTNIAPWEVQETVGEEDPFEEQK